MSKLINTNCLFCKNRADVFQALSDEEIHSVDCNRVSILYKPGEIIFKQGTPCHNFVCITSGLVKVYLEQENCHNVILKLVKPINYILEPGVFSDDRHHFTAVACEETKACLISTQLMRNLLSVNKDFSTEFIKQLSLQSIELINKLSSCTNKQVYGRMADIILYLHSKVYTSNPILLTISRQDIADLAGMTKESAIRVLKKFKDDNLILLEGNTLEILNQPMLESISKNG